MQTRTRSSRSRLCQAPHSSRGTHNPPHPWHIVPAPQALCTPIPRYRDRTSSSLLDHTPLYTRPIPRPWRNIGSQGPRSIATSSNPPHLSWRIGFAPQAFCTPIPHDRDHTSSSLLDHTPPCTRPTPRSWSSIGSHDPRNIATLSSPP